MATATEAPPLRAAAGGEDFRAWVRAFLHHSLPAGWIGPGSLSGGDYDDFLTSWRKTLRSNGLLAVSWPVAYGGAGLTPREQVIVAEEFAVAGVPMGTPNDNFGLQMLGNTLLRLGTEHQREWFLPKILSGEHVWCQGFSEPEAGSDLAGVRLRARAVGDAWVINGQKSWTSYGHLANHIFVLCRTDDSVPPHQGLSLLLVPIDQPGVKVRPFRTMTGEAEFNEVFFDDATCPIGDIVGDPGEGWRAAMLLLGFERGEAAATLPIKFAKDLDRLVELIIRYDRAGDQAIRQRLAQCAEGLEQMRAMGTIAVDRWVRGRDIGAESSLHKLFWSGWLQRTTALAMDVMGLDGIAPEGLGLQGMAYPAAETSTPNTTGAWADYFLRSRAATIYAGASEIQKNIVGERLLGLPRGAR